MRKMCRFLSVYEPFIRGSVKCSVKLTAVAALSFLNFRSSEMLQ